MKKASTTALLIFIPLLLLLTLPLGDEVVTASKIFLASLLTLFLIFGSGINLLLKKNAPTRLTSLTLPPLIFIVVITAAIFFTPSRAMTDILGLGGVYLAMILIAWLGKGLATKKYHHQFLLVWLSSVSLLSIFSTLKLQTPNLMLDYHPTEAPLVTLQILGITLVGLIALTISRHQSKKKTLLNWVTLVIITIGLGVNIYSILPGKVFAPILPSGLASWSIGIDTLRNPQTAFLGSGPSNYHVAYAKLKPPWLNQTQLGNVQFTNGANLPLTLLVSTGALGLGCWLWLTLLILKQVKRHPQLRTQPLTWMVSSFLVSQLLLPPSTSTLLLFGMTLSAWLSLPAQKFTQRFQIKHPALIAQLLGATLVLISLAGAAGLGVATFANYKFYQANQAGQNKQLVEMYQLQQTAIKLNPYLASYHQRYALTNLSIAMALANKADLTAAEQTQVLQLVQQAITEGRVATQLEPHDANRWRVLGQIYRNLIGIADGADQWAVTAYTTAIQTSPSDPSLRVSLGEVLYQTKQLEQAEQLFLQAIQLKPNLITAHYDLANTLVQQNKLEEAVVAYENVLSLLEPTSEDYQAAAAKMQAVQTQIGQQDQ